MNCFFHENKPAVATCAQCNVGLCRDCVNNAITLDDRPLCPSCGKSIVMERLKDAQKDKMWALVKFIFSGFFLGIGLAVFAGGADIMQVWIISGVAGIPTAFKATRRSREQRIVDDVHDRYESDMINLMFGWVMRLLIKLVFMIGLAPICAIYTCISNLIKCFTNQRTIKKYEELLAQIEQSLNEGPDSFVASQPQTNNTMETYVPVQPEMLEPNIAPIPPQANAINAQTAQTFQTSPVASSYQAPASTKRNNALIIGIALGALVLVGLIAGYFMWYVPYAKDRDALRTYVVANNVFLRSSKVAGVEYNILSKVPYGSELITYSEDMEWAEIKVNGVKGFVASPYLLKWNDFKLLNDVWASADAREYIESSKCRLAILDYCKSNQFNTGNEGWQLYTLQKNVKPNNVLFPRLNNGYDKFTEFAFILKNNATQERRFVIYSFDEETERPVFLYEESAPMEGQIKNVKYVRNQYRVTYTGHSATSNFKAENMQQNTQGSVQEIPYIPPVSEKLEIQEEHAQAGHSADDAAADYVADNKIYERVEEMPEFPYGGPDGIMKFISANLKYPTICQESGVQGRVVVTFMVNKDGSTTDFCVVQSVNKYLDEEALRVLSNMPKWKPGKQKGVPVRVKYTVPISFRLL